MIAILKKFQVPFLAFTIWTAYFCLYLLTAPASLPEGDEAIILGVGHRIASHGFSELPQKSANELRDFSFYGFFKSGFSKYGIGQSLLDIPVTKAFLDAKKAKNSEEFRSAMLRLYSLPASIGATTNVLFFLICLKLGRRLDSAFILVIILGTTTMVWPYTQTLFSDPTLATCWLLALYSLLHFRDTNQNAYLGIAGASIGFAFLDKVVAAYAFPIFTLYLLHLLWKQHIKNNSEDPFLSKSTYISISFFLAPLFLTIGLFLYLNYIRFGHAFAFGYSNFNSYDNRDTYFGFNVPFLAGLHGQLLSSGKGFFFYNPSCLLMFLGWKKSFFKNQSESILIAFLVGGALAIYSSWFAWHGDWCWGPRFLSWMPPFFLLIAGPFLDDLIIKIKSKSSHFLSATCLASILVIISFGIQILGVSIKSNQYILTASHPDVLKGKFFELSWPIRDDSLQLHFIPEFSPIAGHFWMLKTIYYRDTPKYQKTYENPPWISLNANWKPKKIEHENFKLNIWWLKSSETTSTKSSLTTPIVGTLLTLFFSLLTIGIIQAFRQQHLIDRKK
jgi:hypothetical protein